MTKQEMINELQWLESDDADGPHWVIEDDGDLSLGEFEGNPHWEVWFVSSALTIIQADLGDLEMSVSLHITDGIHSTAVRITKALAAFNEAL